MMNWKHPRNMTRTANKQNETESGTRWSFIAAMAVGT